MRDTAPFGAALAVAVLFAACAGFAQSTQATTPEPVNASSLTVAPAGTVPSATAGQATTSTAGAALFGTPVTLINTQTGFQFNYGGYGTGSSVPILANNSTMGIQTNENIDLPSSFVASPTTWGWANNMVVHGDGSNFGDGGDFLAGMSSAFVNITGTLPQIKAFQGGLQFWGYDPMIDAAWEFFAHTYVGSGAIGLRIPYLAAYDEYVTDVGTGTDIGTYVGYHCNAHTGITSITNHFCLENDDPLASISTVGPVNFGQAASVSLPAGETKMGSYAVTQTLCSGEASLGTSAISSGGATTVTAACTGLAATDVIQLSFNGSPLGVTGYEPGANGNLTIVSWPTPNTINISTINNTANKITPGAMTLNYRVAR